MKSDDKNIPGSEKNKKTSPTDIKGKDVHEAAYNDINFDAVEED